MPAPLTLNEISTLRRNLTAVTNELRKITSTPVKNDATPDDTLEVMGDGDGEATIGDIVEVAPTTEEGDVIPDAAPVTGEIVEIVETDVDGNVTENSRKHYRRVQNCKMFRNSKGKIEAYVPVTVTNAAPKAPAKSKARYVRVINRKSCNTEDGGRTIDDMQAGVPYKPAYPADQYATITKNLAHMSTLLENALGVKETTEKEIDEALKEKGITQNAAQPKGKRYVRTKNYRAVKNSDGTLEVIIDTTGATDVSEKDMGVFTPAPIEDANTAPIEETLAFPIPPVTVEVVVDGVPVTSGSTENKARKGKAVQTNNELYDAGIYTSNHPALQPFIATNEDLKAMLALAQFCETPGMMQLQTDVATTNAGAEEYFGDAAPLEIPTVFPKEKK